MALGLAACMQEAAAAAAVAAYVPEAWPGWGVKCLAPDVWSTGSRPQLTTLSALAFCLRVLYDVQPHRDARKKKPSLKTASEEEDATQRKQANQLLHQAYQQGGPGGAVDSCLPGAAPVRLHSTWGSLPCLRGEQAATCLLCELCCRCRALQAAAGPG